MVLDFPSLAVLTLVSDGNPLRRLDVRSKAREIGIVFIMRRHDGLLFWLGGADSGLGEGWQGLLTEISFTGFLKVIRAE